MVLNLCFSINGDLAMLFRRTATLSEMVVTHDLRTITNNPAAKLNEKQRNFLKQIGRGRLYDLFLLLFYIIELYMKYLKLQ